MEARLDGEGAVSVDRVALAWAKVVVSVVPEDVDVALAGAVAAREDTSGVRRIAGVANGSERILVGFHDVELRAPVATDLVCVAVLERIAYVVDRGHQHRVKSRDAAAARLAHVHVVLDPATEQVSAEVLRSIEVVDGREIHAIVEVEAELGSVGLGARPARSLNIKRLLLPIDLDVETGVASTWSGTRAWTGAWARARIRSGTRGWSWLIVRVSAIGRIESGAAAGSVAVVPVRAYRPGPFAAGAVAQVSAPLVGHVRAVVAEFPLVVDGGAATGGIGTVPGLGGGPRPPA